jgi:hypothetical protein
LILYNALTAWSDIDPHSSYIPFALSLARAPLREEPL